MCQSMLTPPHTHTTTTTTTTHTALLTVMVHSLCLPLSPAGGSVVTLEYYYYHAILHNPNIAEVIKRASARLLLEIEKAVSISDIHLNSLLFHPHIKMQLLSQTFHIFW